MNRFVTIRPRPIPILALLLLVLVAGCGSGSTESSPEVTNSGEAAQKAGSAAEQPFTPRPHQDSGGGSRQFITKGADNSIQEFGSEASGSDLEEAAEVLHAYLDARAAGAWGAACDRLSPGVVEQLLRQVGSSGGKEVGCAELLAALSAGIPAAVRREAATADIGALRVEGDSGFLIFHGAGSEDFFIPMHREDGGWVVAAIAPSPLG